MMVIAMGAHCSLREAINAANGAGSAVAINFGIPVTDARHFYYKDDGVANHVTNDPSHVLVTTAVNDGGIAGQSGSGRLADPDWNTAGGRFFPLHSCRSQPNNCLLMATRRLGPPLTR